MEQNAAKAYCCLSIENTGRGARWAAQSNKSSFFTPRLCKTSLNFAGEFSRVDDYNSKALDESESAKVK